MCGYIAWLNIQISGVFRFFQADAFPSVIFYIRASNTKKLTLKSGKRDKFMIDREISFGRKPVLFEKVNLGIGNYGNY